MCLAAGLDLLDESIVEISPSKRREETQLVLVVVPFDQAVEEKLKNENGIATVVVSLQK